MLLWLLILLFVIVFIIIYVGARYVPHKSSLSVNYSIVHINDRVVIAGMKDYFFQRTLTIVNNFNDDLNDVSVYWENDEQPIWRADILPSKRRINRQLQRITIRVDLNNLPESVTRYDGHANAYQNALNNYAASRIDPNLVCPTFYVSYTHQNDEIRKKRIEQNNGIGMKRNRPAENINCPE